MVEEKSFPRGKVFLVGAGPGDPGLITLRAVECLRQAQVVVHDRLVNHILLRYAQQAEWIDVGKQPDHHPVPQSRINAILVEQARQGRWVVRLKGGDPCVFGRGGEEALALAEASIPFEIVPGVTSAIAVPAYAGIPVTQRGMVKSLAVITGHRAVPCTDGDLLDSSALGADTLVFLMGVHNLPVIVKTLLECGRASETPVALISEGTTSAQKVVAGSLADILERAVQVKPPAVVVVGEVVKLREKLAWFEDPKERPLFGLRVLNTRPQEPEKPDVFGDLLRQLGAEVRDLPAMQVIPPGDTSGLDRAIEAQAREKAWDWVVFTSANAVKFTLERLVALGYDTRLLTGVKIGAVGDATREALQKAYLKADFIPTNFTGLDWAAEVGDLDGQCVFLPRSEIAPPDLIQALQERGAVVESAAAYTIGPAEPDLETLEMLRNGDIDVVGFFSPSAVRGITQMLEKVYGADQVHSSLERVRIACIGPTTAAAVERLALPAEIVAEEYTAEGLVEAIVRWRTRS
jgi:uroporphyrinogen III methyltransferase/synthase